MFCTLTYLLDTQTRGPAFLDYQRLPYWLGRFVGFDRLDRWLRLTWGWGKSNARLSHANRPWSEGNQLTMLCNLYPDEIPF